MGGRLGQGQASPPPGPLGRLDALSLFLSSGRQRLGDEERRLMHLVPAPAVRLMKRRVLSRPGLTSEVSKRSAETTSQA